MRQLAFVSLLFMVGTGNLSGTDLAKKWKHEAVPTREDLLARLESEDFDLLVIGGGATGCGVALDGVQRGLSVALVEAKDYSSGASSKSTKLLHGGVRYLERAVKELSREQLHLVRDSLHERAYVMLIAPHLTKKLEIATPVYNWWDAAYYYAGLWVYQCLAGEHSLGNQHFLLASEALEKFPYLRAEGLKGAVAYYDGQFDDARLNVTIAMTAVRKGAAAANYLEVVRLIKDEGRVRGAVVRDQLSGKEFDVRAKVVVNATGPGADRIRKMDEGEVSPLLRPSAGTHILLPEDLLAGDEGLLIPKTKDGRVLFVLPWEGGCLAGTTDVGARADQEPVPTEAEIEYLLQHLAEYFDRPLSRKDVKAAWTGLRPLVADSAEKTHRISRDHLVKTSPGKLISVVGGKWTSYRKMAQDTIDQVLKEGCFKGVGQCVSMWNRLRGTQDYWPRLDRDLRKTYEVDEDVAKHLVEAYGGLSRWVLDIAGQGYGARLAEGYPYIEAEVLYAMEQEQARTVDDILYRRTRLGFLDQQAADAAVPRVKELMALSRAQAGVAEGSSSSLSP